jgi:hypothetical protein
MLKVIKGTYQNGQVILEEPAPTNERPAPGKAEKFLLSLFQVTGLSYPANLK